MAPAEALFPEARRAKAEAVPRSVRLGGAYDADQMLVWENVAHKLRASRQVLVLGRRSPSEAQPRSGWTFR